MKILDAYGFNLAYGMAEFKAAVSPAGGG